MKPTISLTNAYVYWNESTIQKYANKNNVLLPTNKKEWPAPVLIYQKKLYWDKQEVEAMVETLYRKQTFFLLEKGKST